MSEAVRILLAYVPEDETAAGELRRHLASLQQQQVIRLDELVLVTDPSDATAAATLGSDEQTADLLLPLLSPALLASSAGRRWIERTAALGLSRTGRPRLLPILLSPISDGRELLPQPLNGQPLDAAKDRGVFLARLTKELTSAILEVSRTARRPLLPVAAPSATPPSTRAASGADAATAPVLPLSGLPLKKWALLVGINRYANSRQFPRLDGCVKDVRELGQTLESLGYQVQLLHDEQERPELLPYRRNVLAQLDELCQRAQAEDLVLVHFAGHGYLQGGQQQLAMMDSDRDARDGGGLPIRTVEDKLRKCVARRRVLLLDACQSGATLTRGSDDAAFVHETFEKAEGFVRLAASTSRQLAQEWQAQQMGAFSYFLNQALRGDKRAQNQYGLTTVQSLANYLLFELRSFTRKNLGQEQEPTIQYEGLGEMVLADYRTPKESR